MITLDERIEAAKKKKSAAEAAYTKADKAEQDKRNELAKIEAEAAAAEILKRDLDLARRLDAARDALPVGTHVRELVVDGLPHTFVIKNAGAKAYNQWEKDFAASAQKGKGIDRAQVSRTYALASVHDWNGITDWNGTNAAGEPNGAALAELLRDYPGIATSIVNVATSLNGLASEERKSAS